MRKKIILTAIMMLFISSLALAQSLIPYPIFVKINAGIPVGTGVDVKITNIDCTDASKCVIERTFKTNDNGEIALDAYDAQRGFLGFRDTDRFKATILYCSGDSSCNQEASFVSRGGSILFNFDLTSVSCQPPSTTTVTVSKYVCYDGTTRDTPDCPVQPAEIKEVTKEVPITDANALAGAGVVGAIISSLLVYFATKYGSFGGFVKTERKKDRYGKFYTAVYSKEQYKKSDGTIGTRWVIKDKIYES